MSLIAMLLFAAPLFSAEGPSHAVKPIELLATLGRADKIVVYDSTPAIYADGVSAPERILYSSADPKDIAELRSAIAVERPAEWFRCACIPPIEIEASWKGKRLGVISVYEDLTIGFSRWSGDARIADREILLKWFDSRGITGPRHRVEGMRAREEADRAASERWIRAMPSSVRPLWPKLMHDSQWWSWPPAAVTTSAKILKPELGREFPESKHRILALFSWFGSGAGPWSGYPAYEDVVPHLLLEYQPSELFAALRDTTLTESETEGAARFFSGYCYGYLFCPPEENKLAPLLPTEIKNSLLEHVLKGSDQDKVARARSAFEQR
jgi:hypothetical protein